MVGVKLELAFLGPKGTYSHQVSDPPYIMTQFVRSDLGGRSPSMPCVQPFCVVFLVPTACPS